MNINQTKFDLTILSIGTSAIFSHSDTGTFSGMHAYTLRGSRQITHSLMTLYQTSKLLRNPTGACLNRGTVIGTCCLGTRAINFLSSYCKCVLDFQNPRYSDLLLGGHPVVS